VVVGEVAKDEVAVEEKLAEAVEGLKIEESKE
jgi:hypothetical protein